MVDPTWLESIRQKNRAKFGMASDGGPGGIAGLGYRDPQELVDALNDQRDIRTVQIHKGLHTRQDPRDMVDPESPQAMARLIERMEVAPPPQIPQGVLVAGGLALVGLVGLVAYAALKE